MSWRAGPTAAAAAGTGGACGLRAGADGFAMCQDRSDPAANARTMYVSCAMTASTWTAGVYAIAIASQIPNIQASSRSPGRFQVAVTAIRPGATASASRVQPWALNATVSSYTQMAASTVQMTPIRVAGPGP